MPVQLLVAVTAVVRQSVAQGERPLGRATAALDNVDEPCTPTAAANIARDASFVLKNISTICNVSCVRRKEVVWNSTSTGTVDVGGKKGE